MADSPDILTTRVGGIDETILLQAIEQNPASIVITAPQGRIIYVNPQFCAVTGYRFDEAVGQNPRVLKGNDGYTDYAELWETLLAGQQWRGEFHDRRKDGEFYWELALISPIFDPQWTMLYYLAIKEDISERKQVDELLHQTLSEATQLTASLELKNFELETAQKELDDAYSQLKEAPPQMLQREKMASIGQLAAGVAHEINNPIGFITSNLGALSRYQQKLFDYQHQLENWLAETASEVGQGTTFSITLPIRGEGENNV